MVKTVLIRTLILCVIGLVLFWLFTGGISAAKRVGQNFTNPIALIFFNGTSTQSNIRLPWQPPIPQGPDTFSDTPDPVILPPDTGETSQQAPSLGTQTSNVRSFGNPSPYVGKIRISDNTAMESDPSTEYIDIEASESNTEPIPLMNWSLQSALTGLRVPLPQGTPLFLMGVINTVQPIYLEPGSTAIVSTGASPVGVSFRENMCSGYLGELQTFTPELSSSCPLGSQALQKSPENLVAYGPNCFDYVDSIPQCHFPTSLSSDLSPACRSFIVNTLSYNGCVNTYRNDPTFTLPAWRIYLTKRSEAWGNTHDVIRLLDEQGRTVDVLTY